jgi:nucleotide-binding universal stress UspA family protein
MFGSILVVLDGSPNSEAAIPLGADEAKRHGSPLSLLRVIPRPEAHAHVHLAHGGPTPISGLSHDPALVAAEREATRYLQQTAARYGLPPSTGLVVAVGDPFRRIVDQIGRLPSPLVVLATDATNGGRGYRLGEVAHRLLLLGVAPVLAVRAQMTDQAIAADAGWLVTDAPTISGQA